MSWPRFFTIWTDHNNLRYLLDPSTTGIKVMKSTMDRLARWAWSIQGLCYRVRVLKGPTNIIADLLSRWGAQGLYPPINEIAKLAKANITVPRPPATWCRPPLTPHEINQVATSENKKDFGAQKCPRQPLWTFLRMGVAKFTSHAFVTEVPIP